MKISPQKDAILSIVQNILGEDYSPLLPMKEYFKYDPREGELFDCPKHKRICQATEEFILMIEVGKIEMPRGHSFKNPEKLKAYARNIIFNWLKKDSRLNGGQQYRPKNPNFHNCTLVLNCLNDKQVNELFKLLKGLSSNKNSPQYHLVKKNLFERINEIEELEVMLKKVA